MPLWVPISFIQMDMESSQPFLDLKYYHTQNGSNEEMEGCMKPKQNLIDVVKLTSTSIW